MSVALQPPAGAPPATRAATASHAALSGVQISFEAMLAQTSEPASSAHAFDETGVLGDGTPAAMRETAAARPASAGIVPQDAAPPTIATRQQPLDIAQNAPTSPSAASPLPQRHASNHTTDLRSVDAPQARVLVSPGASKARAQLQVNQLRAHASSTPRPTPLKRAHPSAFLVALSETASGVRVQARAAALSPTERDRLHQQIHALLAQHGIHSATIEVV